MKIVLGTLFVAATLVLAACESAGTQPAAGKTDQGTPIGSTGVKVSGTVGAGGTVNNR